ncbi:uncharacterized protein PV09_04863 [Verruconis gallopava]|uniref:ATP synthase subunit 4 n=1 Tax=Verruconis gallopava TaxID=253628 RepID=A0A0D1XN90_9PEZI|nr:uncharacterized protein PV09_04863 [Verruconis gallopava]KIW04041.1 hypothetical protein PV09_04863 [Verruconis gallopava]
MAARLSRSAISAARLRPSLTPRALPSIAARYYADVPAEEPKKKAQSILDSLPGSSLASKAAILSAGAGLSIAAISNELYVFNEETIVALSLLTVFWGVGKYGGPAYAEWARGQQDKMRAVLNQARENHTKSVNDRIASVKEFGGVVDITKTLFEISKETAKLEAEAYELEQKTAIAAEAKNVLDSWVRYEQSVKQRQQKELADTVIAKVEKELQNPKVLQQILDQSVKDVERLVSQKA